jgi:hypothetical protein
MEVVNLDIRNIPVYFINLSAHITKRQSLENELVCSGFSKFERVPAVQNQRNGQLGLIATHIEAIAKISTPFILLEDDVSICSQKFHLTFPREADAIYLGNSAWGLWKEKSRTKVIYESTEFPNLMLIRNMLSAHAILFLNQTFLKAAVKLLIEDRSAIERKFSRVDQAYAQVQSSFNVYSLNEPLFYQKHYPDSMTNNEKYTNAALNQYHFPGSNFVQFLSKFVNKE